MREAQRRGAQVNEIHMKGAQMYNVVLYNAHAT